MDILAALYAVAATGVGLTQRSLRLAVDVREAALIPVLDELRNGGFTAIGNDNVWRLGRDLSRTPVSELVHLMAMACLWPPILRADRIPCHGWAQCWLMHRQQKNRLWVSRSQLCLKRKEKKLNRVHAPFLIKVRVSFKLQNGGSMSRRFVS